MNFKMQSADNNYYLNHNYLQEESRAGSIFLDYRNSMDSFSRNTIIYGHRMTTDFYYIETDFSSDEEYMDFIGAIKGKSVFNANVDINQNDLIVTLSTCDYGLNREEGRLVVHVKVVRNTYNTDQ